MKLDCLGQTEEIRLERESAWIGDRRIGFRDIRREGQIEAIEIAGKVHPVRVARDGDRAFVLLASRLYEFRLHRPESRAREKAASERGGDLVSPMPGRVRRVLVSAGERVVRGQVLLILEAMKMEHEIRAPRDGVVTRMAFPEGDLVDAGVALVEMT